MLKRYQILLPEWQAKHYKLVSNKYDLSFSAMIRMALCVDMMRATKTVFPEYKFNLDEKQLKNMMKKNRLVGGTQIDEFHKLLSRLYFEMRKAAEFWEKELKKMDK